ncbi:hypothetical protein WOSG25_090090 [Weissella oryzae SG25]|uniref:Uncharacterized protein n=1 Tax=Weissella oryzae (strain DSM 25784 / JCM 18191 / LMG 30913 / SG25) TaxID=1329250 RepID=A0A069CVC4_WEIOS|nr:hypothetical protein [Weissella oryzae]GAK31312.1 hypothetical protein WOSG25_090090 [Weissella oryzae SG25]
MMQIQKVNAFSRLIHGVLKRKQSQVRPQTVLYEDLSQELWLVILAQQAKIPTLASENNLMLFILLSCRAADYLKKETRLLLRNEPSESSRLDQITETVEPELELSLAAFIEQLDDVTNQRLLRLLVADPTLTHGQRQKSLRLSRATYYRRLNQLRQELKQFLEL